MIPKHIEKNARAIARYLEMVYPHYERSGNVTDLPPFNRKAKGEGDAPVGPHALRLMHNNRDASRVLAPYLEEIKLRRDKWKSIQYRDILAWVVYDPGLVKRWKAAESAEDGLWGEAYEKMTLHLAYLIKVRYPGLELIVRTDPDDEPVDTPVQGRNRDARAARTHNAHTRYRNLIAEAEEIMEERRCTFTEAQEVVNERRTERKSEPVSPATFKRARRYVRGELQEGEAGGVRFSRLAEEAS